MRDLHDNLLAHQHADSTWSDDTQPEDPVDDRVVQQKTHGIVVIRGVPPMRTTPGTMPGRLP